MVHFQAFSSRSATRSKVAHRGSLAKMFFIFFLFIVGKLNSLVLVCHVYVLTHNERLLIGV